MSLLEQISDVGLSVAAFSRLCGGVAPQTLKKLDQNARSVRPEIRARVRRALDQLKVENRKRAS